MAEADDTYHAVCRRAGATLRDRGSRFLGLVWPVESEDEVRGILDGLRKEYYDATHRCYAWRLGPEGIPFRSSDDGEPSGTAGRPILGQLLSRGLSDTLAVVVRWFGGTKLGVPGLINAYRGAAEAALDEAGVCERIVRRRVEVRFPYESMNGVMRLVKELEPCIVSQAFDNICRMELAIRKSRLETLISGLAGLEGVAADPVSQQKR